MRQFGFFSFVGQGKASRKFPNLNNQTGKKNKELANNINFNIDGDRDNNSTLMTFHACPKEPITFTLMLH